MWSNILFNILFIIATMVMQAAVIILVFNAFSKLGTFDSFFNPKRSINQNQNDFASKVISIIEKQELTWEQIIHISETYELTRSNLGQSLKLMLLIALEYDEIDKKKIDFINSYLNEFQKDEPFEGVPYELRSALSDLRDKLSTDEKLLTPLINRIKELTVQNEQELKKQSRVAISSLIVGVFGILVGIIGAYPYIYRLFSGLYPLQPIP